jgi:maltose/moltooligosaccharide transporter
MPGAAPPGTPARQLAAALPAQEVQARAGTAALAGMLGWLLLGDLGIAMRDRAALPSGLELLRVAGATDTATSLLLSTVPALLSMFVVPLVGWRSDRHRSRLGRRRPFLLVAAPAGCGAGRPGVFSRPGRRGPRDAGRPVTRRAACRLAAFGLFWTLFDCAALCALSLFTGLVNDVVPFGWLGRFYALFRIVGLGAGIAFHAWIFALTDRTWRPSWRDRRGVRCLHPGDVPGLARAARARGAGRSGGAWPRRSRGVRDAADPVGHRDVRLRRDHVQSVQHVLPVLRARQRGTEGHARHADRHRLRGVDRLGIRHRLAGRPLRRDAHFRHRHGAVLRGGRAGHAVVDDAASFQTIYLCHVIVSGAWWTAAASMPMALFPRERFVQFNATKDFVVVASTILLGIVQGPVLDLSGHDYRLTLGCGAVFSALCLVCMARLRVLPSNPNLHPDHDHMTNQPFPPPRTARHRCRRRQHPAPLRSAAPQRPPPAASPSATTTSCSTASRCRSAAAKSTSPACRASTGGTG